MALSKDLPSALISVVCIFLLISTSLWVIMPFLAAGIWAIMIVVATWHVYQTLITWLGGRRRVATLLMLLCMLLVLIVPLWLAISTIAEHGEQIGNLSKLFMEEGLPSPPGWVEKIPLVGNSLNEQWVRLASDPTALRLKITPYSANLSRWVASTLGNLGSSLIQFLLIIGLSGFFYTTGEKFADAILRFGQKLGGARGRSSVLLAGDAIRAVALGIGVTALIQSALAGFGLAVVDMPFAALLTAMTLVLCIAQIGALPVLLPSVLWIYWTGHTGTAIGLLLWSIFVGSMDNVLRPFLIQRGANLPFLLIFMGVIGGMLSLGLIGMFVGPVALAVTYTLFISWIKEDTEPESEPKLEPEPEPEPEPKT